MYDVFRSSTKTTTDEEWRRKDLSYSPDASDVLHQPGAAPRLGASMRTCIDSDQIPYADSDNQDNDDDAVSVCCKQPTCGSGAFNASNSKVPFKGSSISSRDSLGNNVAAGNYTGPTTTVTQQRYPGTRAISDGTANKTVGQESGSLWRSRGYPQDLSDKLKDKSSGYPGTELSGRPRRIAWRDPESNDSENVYGSQSNAGMLKMADRRARQFVVDDDRREQNTHLADEVYSVSSEDDASDSSQRKSYDGGGKKDNGRFESDPLNKPTDKVKARKNDYEYKNRVGKPIWKIAEAGKGPHPINSITAMNRDRIRDSASASYDTLSAKQQVLLMHIFV